MAGHFFDVLHVHEDTGEIDIRWHGKDSRVITCRVPVDDQGHVLPDAEFKKAIMEQCLDRLQHWDRLVQAQTHEAKAKVGRRFDVTEDYTLRNVEDKPRETITGFKLEDHI